MSENPKPCTRHFLLTGEHANLLAMARSDLTFNWQTLNMLTPDLAGTGGQIRSIAADFRVIEIPLYTPCGEGDHVYLRMRKEGHNTNFMLKQLAEQIGMPLKHLGVAGLKDRHAITEQWISIPAKYERFLSQYSLENVEILETVRHTNKLGIGHLQGNRFEIRVRGAENQAEQAQKILDILLQQGLPNYFGPQRFGVDGKNAEQGLRFAQNGLRGRASIAVKRFLISALQSQLFNAFLATRIERGIFDGLIEGDMAKKHDTGGVFRVEDGIQESPRAKAGLVSALGTLYGRKVKPLDGEAGALEAEILENFGLRAKDFNARMGDRRLTRVYLKNASITPTEDGFWIAFELPKGSFATSVLREILKTEVDTEDQDEETPAQDVLDTALDTALNTGASDAADDFAAAEMVSDLSADSVLLPE